MKPTADVVQNVVDLERAFAADPGNFMLQEKLHNLAASHGLVRPDMSLLEEAAGLFAANTWWILVSALGFIFLVAVGARVARRRGAGLVAASAAVLLSVSAIGAFAHESRLARAVVTEVTALKTAPTEHADTLKSAQAGDVLRTRERHGEWTEVIAADGTRAWLPSRRLASVTGP